MLGLLLVRLDLCRPGGGGGGGCQGRVRLERLDCGETGVNIRVAGGAGS